jgi:DNA-binding MarR family transcriptional regulator
MSITTARAVPPGGGGRPPPASRRLERVVKGFANHRRIQILRLLETDDSLSLLDICRRLHLDNRTGCEHVRRIHLAGLVNKHSQGRRVLHQLSDAGRVALACLRALESPAHYRGSINQPDAPRTPVAQ